MATRQQIEGWLGVQPTQKAVGYLALVAGAALFVLVGALIGVSVRPPGAFWRVVGVFALIAGLGLALWAGLATATQKNQLLIDGPYRWVRNPLEMGGVLLVGGVALLAGPTFLVLYAVLVAAGAAIVVRPRIEAGLEQAAGASFRRYRQRVMRWRPRRTPYDPAHDDDEPAMSADRTTPGASWIVLYDGNCQFCQAQKDRLVRLAAPGAVVARDFNAEGVLDDYPGVTREACLLAMHTIAPTGEVYAGMEAVARALATRRPVGLAALGYYAPGVRLLADLVYSLIAKNRYRLMKKKVEAGECDGSCSLHYAAHTKQPGAAKPAKTDAAPEEPKVETETPEKGEDREQAAE